MMPLAGPLAAVPAEMLRNFRPEAPIVVFATFRAVAVVVVRVLVVSVAVTVPPPVAVKAGLAPVLAVMAPVKLIVAPPLLVNEIPLPVSLMVFEKLTVSEERPVTTTELPEVLVIGIPRVMLPLPPLMLTAVPEAPAGSVIWPLLAESAVLPTPPKALTSDRPVVVELMLRRNARDGRLIEALLMSIAGPPFESKVEVPEATRTRVPVDAVRAPVPVTTRPEPASL